MQGEMKLAIPARTRSCNQSRARSHGHGSGAPPRPGSDERAFFVLMCVRLPSGIWCVLTPADNLRALGLDARRRVERDAVRCRRESGLGRLSRMTDGAALRDNRRTSANVTAGTAAAAAGAGKLIAAEVEPTLPDSCSSGVTCRFTRSLVIFTGAGCTRSCRQHSSCPTCLDEPGAVGM